MTTGEKIKYLRELKKLTQEELAHLTNLTNQTIYKYENNIVINIPYSKVEKIAETLQVSPSYLLGWEDNTISELNLNKVPISERLCEALFIRGMKQSELTKKTGLSRSSINNYMYGKFEPKFENIQKIAKALDVNDKWLSGYDVPMDCFDVNEISSKQENKIINENPSNDTTPKESTIIDYNVYPFKTLEKERSLYASISGRLYDALYRKDIKHSDLAKKAKIKESLIHSILSGHIIPSNIDMKKIAKALNISVDWLNGYNVPMNPSNSEESEIQQNNELLNMISDTDETTEDTFIIDYSEEELKLLENYNKLNDLGKSEAYKRVEELTFLNKYCIYES